MVGQADQLEAKVLSQHVVIPEGGETGHLVPAILQEPLLYVVAYALAHHIPWYFVQSASVLGQVNEE